MSQINNQRLIFLELQPGVNIWGNRHVRGISNECKEEKIARRRSSGRYSEAEVEAPLADAGRVLLALPWANCFPFGLRTLWSEAEVDASARRPIPTLDQIRAMDQAYRWTALIARPEERRLVLMRSLVLPASASGRPRYIWSWRRLQRATGFHPDTLKTR
jgi:hypothetical protein